MSPSVLISDLIYDTHHPEFEEILKDCCCNEYTVQHGVGEEKQEKFVVGKAHAVVHPKRTQNNGIRTRLIYKRLQKMEIQAKLLLTKDSDGPSLRHIFKRKTYQYLCFYISF